MWRRNYNTCTSQGGKMLTGNDSRAWGEAANMLAECQHSRAAQALPNLLSTRKQERKPWGK